MPNADLSVLVRAHVDRGIADLKRRDYTAAIARFDSALTIDPSSERTHVLRGRALARLERFNEALAAIGHALRLKPTDTAAMTERGTVYMALNQHEKALSDFDTAIHAGARKPADYFHRGAVLFNLKQWSRAAEDFSTTLKQEKSARTFFYRGLCRRQLNDFDGSLADFTSALQADPKYVDAIRERALLLAAAQRTEQAIADATGWIEMCPGLPEALALRGELYHHLDCDAEALADYRAALAIAPSDAKAVNRVAWLLATSNEDAVRDAKLALEMAEQANSFASQSDPLILDTLATARKANGDIAGAREAIDRAISIAPPELRDELIRRRESL